MLARQMEHSCSRRWTTSSSRRAKACLKPPECINWRDVAGNLAISCLVLAGLGDRDVLGGVGPVDRLRCHGVGHGGVRTSRRPELEAKAASRRELRRHARLAYVATCINALRHQMAGYHRGNMASQSAMQRTLHPPLPPAQGAHGGWQSSFVALAG